MKKNSPIRLILAGVVMFIFTALFSWIILSDNEFKEYAVKTDATVINVERIRNHNPTPEHEYDTVVTVRFNDINGNEITAIVDRFDSVAMKIGKTITVWYDPADTQVVRFEETTFLFVLIFVFAGAGLFLIGLGSYRLFNNRND